MKFILYLTENFLLQTLFTFGIIILFGLIVWIWNRAFYRMLGGAGRAVCLVTGCIGTPIHEVAHALMCLVFGHKIVEIKLYQIDSADGTLGYVKHSYNPKNVWARIGCFFIGIAPVAVGAGILLLLAYLLLPEMFEALSGLIAAAESGLRLSVLADIVRIFFSGYTQANWWLFVLLGSLVAIHMNLSAADRKGAAPGLIAALSALLLVNIVLAAVDAASGTGLAAAVTDGCRNFGYALIVVILFSAVFGVLLLGIALLTRFLRGR